MFVVILLVLFVRRNTTFKILLNAIAMRRVEMRILIASPPVVLLVQNGKTKCDPASVKRAN